MIRSPLTAACVEELFAQMERTVRELAPHRRHTTPAEERTLARFCLVMAAFEAAWRGGPMRAWPPPFIGEASPSKNGQSMEATRRVRAIRWAGHAVGNSGISLLAAYVIYVEEWIPWV